MSAPSDPGDRPHGERGEDPGAGNDVSYVGPSHVVRPRWSWAGLALLLIGGVVAGLGVASTVVWLIVVGAVLLAVGAFAAVRGNLFYDIEGSGLSSNNEKRVAPGATAQVDDDDMRSDVAAEEDELAAIRGREGVRPSLRKPAAGLLVLLGAWLIATQGVFYERDPAGRDGTFRALTAGILLVLPGLYLVLKRSSVVAAAICLVAGIGLVVGGVLAAGPDTFGPVNEILCGVLVLLVTPLTALPALRGRQHR